MKATKDIPTFVISLDFELYFGMVDKVSLAKYDENILGVRKAVPGMLSLFRTYDVEATWATLGLISFEKKEDLLASLPEVRPSYDEPSLSPYAYIESAEIGSGEVEDKYHFAASLIREIQAHPGQEIASHTFSHYYCLEAGQTEREFRADLEASRNALARFGVSPESLVLPRNQSRKDYLRAIQELGFRSYRGNQPHWLYEPRAESRQTNLFIRAVRLLDHYLPLSGAHAYSRGFMRATHPYNLAASMFFRPYSETLAFLEPLKRRRIKRAMTRAAEEGKTFHLWWHPHNFGKDTDRNLENLEDILRHYARLRERYGMRSMNMKSLADSLAHE